MRRSTGLGRSPAINHKNAANVDSFSVLAAALLQLGGSVPRTQFS